ncbi:Uncharacterised protein [Mycobacterium tuberculosis]|nr:Uncharacterised protein [Mycobacterium tuberculosis]CKT73158.1 Uncharacterised protein [Mycobacterium tuberculosis]
MLGKYPLGPYHQPLTLASKAFETVSAIDQGDVEFAFELGDCRRQRRLRHVALLSGPSEMPLLGDRDEVLQLTEEHPHLLGLGTDSAEANARPRGLPIRTRGAAGLSRNCLLGPQWVDGH